MGISMSIHAYPCLSMPILNLLDSYFKVRCGDLLGADGSEMLSR